MRLESYRAPAAKEDAMQRTAAKANPGAAGQDQAILADLNEGYVGSVARSDVGWFEKHLTPDFLNTNPDGSLVDRAAFLRQIARPIAITGLRCEDVRIRILGDTAIIHARTVYTMP